MTTLLGELAGLGTSIAWTFTAVFFTVAGREVGSEIVNRSRLLGGLILVGLIHLLTQGQVLPLDAEGFRWGWLGLSGVIGFALGDAFLFQAFIVIGARMGMLLMALAPVISTLMGWLFLGENLEFGELLGIAVTVAGIALVVSDRPATRMDADPEPEETAGHQLAKPGSRAYLVGVLLGVGAATGQALGFMASRLGLEGDFPIISGNIIRLLVAATVLWIYAAVRGKVAENFRVLNGKRKAILPLVVGIIFGPVTGVMLSLYAVDNAPLGIATTLTSLMPIFLLPVGRIVFGERFGVMAIIGTLVAVVGTVLIFVM